VRIGIDTGLSLSHHFTDNILARAAKNLTVGFWLFREVFFCLLIFYFAIL
jgi:hypothetical protein